MAILLLLVTLIAFLTDSNRDLAHVNPWILFAVHNHTWIMAGLIIVAVGFGFSWAQHLFKEIEKSKKTSKSILDVVYLFLNIEERKIINFLVEHKGKTTQSEISRLQGMNRVKAYRSLKKMQEKQIILIESHGKIRKIILQPQILKTINQEN